METFTKKDTRICKGIAVILLLAHHSIAVLAATTFLSGTAQMAQAVSLAKLCVAVFSVLSGHGLYRSFDAGEETSLKASAAFVGRHLWKVYRVFWLCVAVLLVITAVFWGNPASVYGDSPFFSFLLDCLGLSYLLGTSRFVNSWWYITLVLIDYILFPVLYWIVKKLKWLNFLLLAATAALVPFVCGTNSIAIYSVFFLYGMIFAECGLFDRLLDWPGRVWEGRKACLMGKLGLLFLTAVLLAALCVFRQRVMTKLRVEYYLDWLPAAVLISLMSQCAHLLPGKRRGLLEFLGDYSFEIYIVHGMFLKYFSGFVYRNFVWWKVLLRLLLVSAALAWLIRRMRDVLVRVAVGIRRRHGSAD